MHVNPLYAQVVNNIYEICAFGKYVLDPRTQKNTVSLAQC